MPEAKGLSYNLLAEILLRSTPNPIEVNWYSFGFVTCRGQHEESILVNLYQLRARSCTAAFGSRKLLRVCSKRKKSESRDTLLMVHCCWMVECDGNKDRPQDASTASMPAQPLCQHSLLASRIENFELQYG